MMLVIFALVIKFSCYLKCWWNFRSYITYNNSHNNTISCVFNSVISNRWKRSNCIQCL